ILVVRRRMHGHDERLTDHVSLRVVLVAPRVSCTTRVPPAFTMRTPDRGSRTEDRSSARLLDDLGQLPWLPHEGEVHAAEVRVVEPGNAADPPLRATLAAIAVPHEHAALALVGPRLETPGRRRDPVPHRPAVPPRRRT